MEALIGPAIVAAFIAALVSVAGWFVTSYQAIRSERRRRQEKVRDFQIALRAEIRSELASLEHFDLNAHLAEIRTRYQESSTYAVTVLSTTRHLVFEALVSEIHVLPEGVIDPLVVYMQQRQVIESQVADIRNPQFSTLSQERQLEIYEDYIDMRRFLLRSAQRASEALNASLVR